MRAAAARGPNAAQALGLERVHNARDERGLRADDRQVRVFLGRQAHDALDILGRNVDAARVSGDARVAGRAQHLRSPRAAQQRADDRVLAPAAAGDQHAGRGHCVRCHAK